MKQGWKISDFENCLEKVVYTNKIQKKDFKECGNYPIISQEQDFINGYWDNKNDLFKTTKPVVIFGDHTQVKKYVDFDFVLGADGVKIFQTKNHIVPKYFYYFLQNAEIGNLGYARHYRLLKEIPVSYPKSLSEQQQIVSILDQCFSAIDQAKANAEQNLKNAKELFESYLQGVFENGKWETKMLGDVVDKIMTGPFGSMLHQSDYVEKGIPVVNPQNIVAGQIIPLQKTMINKETFNRLKKYALKLDDIVIARRGEMGRCAVVRNENVDWLCGTGNFVIRVNPKKMNSDFLNVNLSSKSVKQKLEKSSIGATMSNLNQTILSDLSISIPPLKEQKTIIRQLDTLQAETQKLEIAYKKRIAGLEELRKNILQRAFAGELTENL